MSASGYDGSITLGVKAEVDTKSVQTELKTLEETFKEIAASEKSLGSTADSFSNITDNVKSTTAAIADLSSVENSLTGDTAFDKLAIKLEQAKYKAESLAAEIGQLQTEQVPTEEFVAIQKQIERADSDLSKLNNRMFDFEALGGDTNSKSFMRMRYQAEQLKETIEYATADMQELIQSGGAYTTGGSPEKIQELTLQYRAQLIAIQELEAKLNALNQTEEQETTVINEVAEETATTTSFMDRMIDRVRELGASSNTTTASMRRGFKKSLTTIIKYAFGVRLLFSLYRKLRTAIADAVKEMSKQVPEVNSSMSALKTALNGVKGALGTAFQPLLSVVTPALTSFLNILTNVITKVAQFIALMSNQKYIYKATAAQVDYAKSLDSTSKSAKNTTLGLDELNVISDESSSSSSSDGGVSYTQEPIDANTVALFDKVKAILKEILPLVALIGAILAGWTVFKLLTSLAAVAPLLATILGWLVFIAGVALAVYNYVKMWQDGVNWSNLIGYITGVAVAVGAIYFLLGPLAAGIVLVVAGIAGLVLALHDIATNGLTAQNVTLLLISAIGLLGGIALIAGASMVKVTAGMVLLCVGVIAVVWAIKDFNENGLTLTNTLVAVAGAVAITVGTFLLFGSGAAFVVGAILAVVGILGSLLSATESGRKALEDLKNLFGVFGEALKLLLTGDVEGAIETLKNYNWKQLGHDLLQGLLDGLKLMGTEIKDFFTGLWTDVVDKFKGFFQIGSPSKLFEQYGSWTLEGMLNGLKSQSGNILDNLTNLYNNISGVFTNLGSVMSSLMQSGFSTVSNVIKNAIHNIGTVINTLSTSFKTVFNGINVIVRTAMNAVKTTITSIVQTIRTGNTAHLEAIKNVWINTFNTIKVQVINIMKALWNGMATILNLGASGIENVINGVIKLLNLLIGTLNKVLGFTGLNITAIPYSASGLIPRVPMLAQGAVIPPNQPFLAMLGDQQSGTNVEAPLSTIQNAVALVLEPYLKELVQNTNELASKDYSVNIGDREIARAANRGQKAMGLTLRTV